MRSVLDRMAATPFERYCAYLTAGSESRYFNGRKQLMQDKVTYTVGMFQQSPKYWTGLTDIAKATEEFLVALRQVKRVDPSAGEIRACFRVQRWNAPEPDTSWGDWWMAKETQNYINFTMVVGEVMADPLYFTHHPDGIKE